MAIREGLPFLIPSFHREGVDCVKDVSEWDIIVYSQLDGEIETESVRTPFVRPNNGEQPSEKGGENE